MPNVPTKILQYNTVIFKEHFNQCNKSSMENLFFDKNMTEAFTNKKDDNNVNKIIDIKDVIFTIQTFERIEKEDIKIADVSIHSSFNISRIIM